MRLPRLDLSLIYKPDTIADAILWCTLTLHPPNVASLVVTLTHDSLIG